MNWNELEQKQGGNNHFGANSNIFPCINLRIGTSSVSFHELCHV